MPHDTGLQLVYAHVSDSSRAAAGCVVRERERRTYGDGEPAGARGGTLASGDERFTLAQCRELLDLAPGVEVTDKEVEELRDVAYALAGVIVEMSRCTR